jgi:two-component system chemotaxis response regulator CheY
MVRKMLRALLETHADWQVCAEAANGLEAVQKAAELKPDAIILDLAMPEMDGLHAAREILSNSPAVPILLHTNHAFSTLALEAKKNGIREVINKSGSEQELISAVEALLNEPVAVARNSDCVDKVPDVGELPDVSNLPEVDKLPADQNPQSSQKFETT